MTEDYSAFAFIAIESIWPSPTGFNKEKGFKTDGKAANTEGLRGTKTLDSTRAEYSGDSKSEDFRGYYRILPLNIISFTSSSAVTGENSWSVNFTLEDLVLVGAADESKGKTKSGSTGTVFDGLRAIIPDILGMMHGESAIENTTIFNSDKLKNLGLAAHRFGTEGGMFSIEDLVTPGDTVTIWFYNDPRTFSAGLSATSATKNIKNNTVAHKFTSIVGSGDRTTQFFTSDEEADSVSSSVSNDAIKKTANALVLGGKAVPASFGDSYYRSLAGQISNEALTYSPAQRNSDDTPSTEAGAQNISGYTAKGELTVDIYYNKDTGDISQTQVLKRFTTVVPVHNAGLYITEKLGFTGYVTPKIEYKSVQVATNDITHPVAIDEKGASNQAYVFKYNKTAQELLYFLVKYQSIESLLTDAPLEQQQKNIENALEKAKTDPKAVQSKGIFKGVPFGKLVPNILSSVSYKSFIHGYNYFKKLIKAEIEKEVKLVQSRGTAPAVKGIGDINRKLLTTDVHGETAYLVQKGQVTSIVSNLRSGASEVTLSGTGMEYVMNKHTVFYDTSLSVDGEFSLIQDTIISYMALSPAKAMLHFLTRWIPREIQWGKPNSLTTTMQRLAGAGSTEKKKEILNRGNILFVRSALVAPVDINKPGAVDPKAGKSLLEDSRVFSPINFVNLTRMGEIIRAFEKADPSGEIVNSTAPYNIQSNVSVMTNCKAISGAQNIMEFFVDEAGYIRFRPTTEAWERAPQPIFTPTVEQDAIQSISYSRNDEGLATTVDVQPVANLTAGSMYNAMDRFSWGRAVPRPGNVPISDYKGMNPEAGSIRKTMSPELFRYGLRYQLIGDFYGNQANVARTKAYMILRFYKDPIKRAEVSVLGNPSYRVGNTTMLYLPDTKRRSNAYIEVKPYLAWVRALSKKDVLVRRFVTLDERLTHSDNYTNEDFSITSRLSQKAKTSQLNKPFILKQIEKTLKWMFNQGITGFSADLFPTTLWCYLNDDSKAIAAHENIVNAYEYVIKTALGMSTKLDINKVKVSFRYVKLNNFICQSYYIDAVSHTFVQNTEASTKLTLSYGQDNIAIIDPAHMIPLGFFSVERKVKDEFKSMSLYDGNKLNLEVVEVYGSWRNLMTTYFEEQERYLAGSFMYQGQAIRNTGIYLNKLASKTKDIEHGRPN